MKNIYLVYREIDELHFYNENLRINSDTIDILIESIKEFGFINPIIINKNNLVICGEARLQAAKLLKLEVIPCIVIDHLTEEQEKIYRLVDNKTTESTYWNYKELNKEIRDINKNLLKYDLISDDTSDIDIDDFFEDTSVEQITLF